MVIRYFEPDQFGESLARAFRVNVPFGVHFEQLQRVTFEFTRRIEEALVFLLVMHKW